MYRGNSEWQFQIDLHCTLVRSTPTSLHVIPFSCSFFFVCLFVLPFCSTGVWTQVITLVRRALYHSSHSAALPFSSPLKVIARGFFVLFHISIWSPSTIHTHLNLLHSPRHSLKYPTHIHPVPILQSCLLLLIFKLTFKGISQCIPTMRIFYFGPFNPFHYTSLPLYLPPPITAFSAHPYILYLHNVTFYNIVDALPFSFPFPPSLSYTE
jgi:hypothetical protein